jgi:hypothetical protein
MDSDVDDVGALAMLHAMMVSSTCPGSAACIDTQEHK